VTTRHSRLASHGIPRWLSICELPGMPADRLGEFPIVLIRGGGAESDGASF